MQAYAIPIDEADLHRHADRGRAAPRPPSTSARPPSSASRARQQLGQQLRCSAAASAGSAASADSGRLRRLRRQRRQRHQGSGSSSTGVTIAGTLSGSPAANAGLTAGRHDHLGRRPVGLLGQRHRADPGQVPPGRQDLDQLGGPVRPVADRDRDPGQRPGSLGQTSVRGGPTLRPAPARASDPRPPPGITGFRRLISQPGDAGAGAETIKPPVRDKNDMTPARGGTGARGETPRGGRPAGGGRAGAEARVRA